MRRIGLATSIYILTFSLNLRCGYSEENSMGANQGTDDGYVMSRWHKW